MKRLYLTKIYGIPVTIDYSWFLVLGLLIWSVGGGYFQQLFPWMHRSEHWFYGIITGIFLFLSVIIHEFVLTKTMLNTGMRIRGITLYFFGGIEEFSVEPVSPRMEFKIALYGFLSIISLLLFFGVVTFIIPSSIKSLSIVKLISNYLFTINCLFFLANCLPVFPLDGGRIARTLLWKHYGDSLKATEMVTSLGRGVAYFLTAAGILVLIKGYLFYSIWLLFFGIFLKQAIESGFQYIILKRSLAGLKVRDIMSADVITVPPDLSLKDLTEKVLWKHRYQSYPVVSDKTFLGIVRLNDMAGIPQDEWSVKTVKEAMTTKNEKITVEPDCDLAKALFKVTHNNLGRLAVLDFSDQLIGYVSHRDIAYLLTLKSKT